MIFNTDFSRKAARSFGLGLLTLAASGLYLQPASAADSGAMDAVSVAERIRPYGSVRVAGMPEPAAAPAAAPATASTDAAASTAAPAAGGAADGEALYQQVCKACHDLGVANAPKLGDKAAWGPRIATGMDALLNSALNGKGAMPPKGGAMHLNEEQIRTAIEYMVNQAK